ncbi:MAG: hypothetical protein LBK22_04255, partial [Tannerella sp.]|nr:hypothetical protein [Tannerella sp.]
MKTVALNLSILFTVCCHSAFPQSTGVQFEHLSVEDGLSQLSVISIFQDKQGFMWFGTRNGLNRYDGYGFETFQEFDTGKPVSNGQIECIAEDGQNRLWAGTRRGLNRYDAVAGCFIPYFHAAGDSTLSHDNITSLFRDRAGNLWVGSMHGLNRYLPETDNFKRYPFNGLLSDAAIYALAEDTAGNLWIGTGRGLFIYNPLSEKMLHPQETVQERISCLLSDSRGRMWIGFHQNGISMYDASGGGFIRFGRSEGLNHVNVRSIEEDRDG